MHFSGTRRKMALFSTGSTSSSEDVSDDEGPQQTPGASPHSETSQPSRDPRSRTETSSDSEDSDNDEIGRNEAQRSEESSSEGGSEPNRPQHDSVSETANDSKFTLGSSDEGSRSPPSERQPESHPEGSESPPSERQPESHPEGSESPPSERQPEPRQRRTQISSDEGDDDLGEGNQEDDIGQREEASQDIDNIDLSESDDDDRDENRDMTEEDIVGPRLYADPEAQEEEQESRPPTIVEVNTARIDPTFTTKGLYFVKLPNFLSVDSRPFDQDHYEDEIDEDEYLDEEGRARLKLKVENTLRWRYKLGEDGNLTRESNAKIVRWDDGSMSLKLGNELFDVQCQPMQRDNHLFMRQGAGLQGHAVFGKKLVFRPFSTDSITHRKVTLSMADRTSKSQKVKVINDLGQDPEAQKAEMVRREEERLRAQNRREAQQRRNRMRPSVRTGLSASYLEDREYDSEQDEGIAAIKRRYKAAAFDDAPLIGRSDSEESDSQRLHEAQKDSDESDSEQERKNQQRKKKVIIEEDED